MTRRSLKGLVSFQGLYLLAGEHDDIYVQHVTPRRARDAAGPFAALMALDSALGFAVFQGQSEEMRNIRFDVKRSAAALGLYRWPTAWCVSWDGASGEASVELALLSRTTIFNYVLAGFGMGIMRGTLTRAGHTLPVYGLAELLLLSSCLSRRS